MRGNVSEKEDEEIEERERTKKSKRHLRRLEGTDASDGHECLLRISTQQKRCSSSFPPRSNNFSRIKKGQQRDPSTQLSAYVDSEVCPLSSDPTMKRPSRLAAARTAPFNVCRARYPTSSSPTVRVRGDDGAT